MAPRTLRAICGPTTARDGARWGDDDVGCERFLTSRPIAGPFEVSEVSEAASAIDRTSSGAHCFLLFATIAVLKPSSISSYTNGRRKSYC